MTEPFTPAQLQGSFAVIVAARDLQRAFASAGLHEYMPCIDQLIADLEARKVASYGTLKRPTPGEPYNPHASPYTGPKA